MRPFIVLGMIALAACQPTDKNQAPTGVVAKAMDEAAKGLGEASQEMDKAREEIATATAWPARTFRSTATRNSTCPRPRSRRPVTC